MSSWLNCNPMNHTPPPSSAPSNRPMWFTLGLVIVLFAVQEIRFRSVLRELSTVNSRLDPVTEDPVSHQQGIETKIQQPDPGSAGHTLAPAYAGASTLKHNDPVQSVPARLNRLETQLQGMQRSGARLASGRVVPEYDASRPAPTEA
jgi:hypothetical protein